MQYNRRERTERERTNATMNERTENVHQREKTIVTKPNLPDTSRPLRKRRSIAEREATNSRRSGVPHQHPARLAPASERDADWPKIERMCARMQCERSGSQTRKGFRRQRWRMCRTSAHNPTQRRGWYGSLGVPTRTGVTITAPACAPAIARRIRPTRPTTTSVPGAFS